MRVMEKWDKGKLEQLWRQQQLWRPREALPRSLKANVDMFMRQAVIPRQKKLAQLARGWVELLPEELVEHSCLEDYRAGRLRVLVDSAPHLAELDMLVRERLLDQLRQVCPGVPLWQIRLVRGRWYHLDENGNKISNYN